MTDEQLIQRLQNGEQEALSELYDHCASIVLGVLFKIIGNHAVAEELFQETFW
ncbi:MAG: RNA polymerase sigma factor [Candidatus Promineifilaceae bacterium]